MDTDKFWSIIESSGSPSKCTPNEQCENIAKQLSGSSKEELVSFNNIHRGILNSAYTWPMLKANFIIVNYVSDDVFEDFRNWVILHGKEIFQKSLENPDVIAEYIQVEDPVEEVTGEPLTFVCEEVWDGEIEELEKDYIYPKEPDLDMDWPPKKDLEKQFPRLYAKFWDDEQIEYNPGQH